MGFRLVLVRFLVVPVGSTGGFRVLHTPFITRYGVEVSYFTIMPPAEHNFEHNTLASRMTPESTILFFSTIIRQTSVSSFALGTNSFLTNKRVKLIVNGLNPGVSVVRIV